MLAHILSVISLLISLCFCASKVDQDYHVVCWGGNQNGELGIGDQYENSLPQHVDLSLFKGQVTQISAGTEFNIALDSLGNVYTWGDNKYCQNGFKSENTDDSNDETNSKNSIPRRLPLDQKVKFISAGGRHGFALVDDTRVYVWGANEYGQSKPESEKDICTPELIDFSRYLESGEHILKIVGGEQSSYILTKSGQVYSWGGNDFGQLGYRNIDGNPSGTLMPNLRPSLVKIDLKPAVNCDQVDDIHAGRFYVHATCEHNQKLIGWGDNTYFQVNESTTEGPRYIEKPVFIGPKGDDEWTLQLKSISGYDRHVVMFSGKSLVCWGDSMNSECGYPEENPIIRPNFRSTRRTIGEIVTAGEGFTVISDTSGIVQATGSNVNYQLGTAAILPPGSSKGFVPVDFSVLDPRPNFDPYIIASGLYHTCILFGNYTPPKAEPLSFIDVYVWFLAADGIISFIYFVVIGIMECVKR